MAIVHICLFFFYVLIVNATHNNFTIQQGFDPLPRTSFDCACAPRWK